MYVVFQQALKIRFDLMIIFCCWVESRLAFLETNLTRLTTTAATTPTTAEQQQRRMLLLLMSPLYQALRACRILCLVSCVLASSVVIEKVIRAHQILLCCGAQKQASFERSLRTTDDYTSYLARHCSAGATSCLYYLCRRCTKRIGVVLSCVPCSWKLGAFETSSVCAFCPLASLSRNLLFVGGMRTTCSGGPNYAADFFFSIIV